MVLISEITEEVAKKEGEPKEGDGEPEEEEKTEEGDPEERAETEKRPQEPAGIDPGELAAPPTEDPKEDAPPQAGKMLYNEYAHALRVAYIMRNYLYMRQGGAAAAGGGAAGEERCRAMMEVVRKESGRWAVSRVVLEHTHPLEPPPDPAGALAGGGLVPRVDMEFDSISAAKAYYSTYGEKMGFKAQTGSGKRSRGNRILIMQRFLCSKGSYPPHGNAADGAKGRRRWRCLRMNAQGRAWP